MEQQEYFMRVQMLGQEAEKIEQQIQLFDGQITEFNAVRESLESIQNNAEKEILANLGKGIFIKAEIKNKDLYVNVGKDVIVKKDIPSALKIVDEQSRKLLEGKEELIERIAQIQEKMQEMIGGMNLGHACSDKECDCEHDHECDGDCDCEEPCEDCKQKE
jgi:prefoldin alpha subunit